MMPHMMKNMANGSDMNFMGGMMNGGMDMNDMDAMRQMRNTMREYENKD